MHKRTVNFLNSWKQRMWLYAVTCKSKAVRSDNMGATGTIQATYGPIEVMRRAFGRCTLILKAQCCVDCSHCKREPVCQLLALS